MGQMTVIEHQLDEAAGVYRMVIGERVVTEVPAPTESDPEAVVEVVDYVNVRDVLFDASAEEWFTAHGERRSHKHVAEAQRQRVRAALSAPEPEVQQRKVKGTEVQTMPGQGEAL